MKIMPPSDVGLTLGELLSCSGGWESVIASNYMIDFQWMLKESPDLQLSKKIVLLSGERNNSHIFIAAKQANVEVEVISPHLPIPYGTHHSKFLLCFSRTGVRVAIFTANFICDDWERKTQGVYVQDFPRSKSRTRSLEFSDFGGVLQYYLSRCGVLCNELTEHDFSLAQVFLVPSVPGYHQHGDIDTFGMGRLRNILKRMPKNCNVPESAPMKHLSWQYSSQGSLTKPFLHDLTSTMLGRDANVCEDVVIDVHFPTEQQVRNSVEGWRGGSSIPVYVKNCHEFINQRLHRWGLLTSDHPRKFAMPHIKSYSRHNGSRIEWLLVSSANLSRAAFGEFQKGGTQLAIRSYELGVLYHPYLFHDSPWFSCTESPLRMPHGCASLKRHSFVGSQTHNSSAFLPYDIFNPQPYESTLQLRANRNADVVSRTDVPWVVDIPHVGLDCLGFTVDVLSTHSHYGPASWEAPTKHFETWVREVFDVDKIDSLNPTMKRCRSPD